MHDILKKLGRLGIIPVIKIDNVSDAVPLAKALCDGGLPCAEITFRTDAAEESIRRITQALPDMLVGAGTVLTTDQVDRAVAAGAKFIISPGLNPTIVKYCMDKDILITPGCATPSDIEVAIELGLGVVKFFPAEANGGINAIKAMSAPYTQMKFMPTGGVNAKNLNDYLSYSKIIACGGSWMVDPKLINAGDFAGIEKLTREAIQTMLGFSIMHAGAACQGDTAKLFCKTFGSFLENKNQITIGTNYLDRGKAYLESLGFTFNMDTYTSKSVFMNEKFGDLAVQLMQK